MSVAASLTIKQRQDLLREAYHEVTRNNGLRDFILEVRTRNNDLSGKYSVKQARLATLFSNVIWREMPKGGHRKIKNVITGVVIEYSNHQKKIDPGAVETILETLQRHLNMLGNKFFTYHQNNFKDEPDYLKAAYLWA